MASSRDEEPRRRKKEYDRDPASTSKDKDKDKDRHRSSKKLHHKRSEVDVDRPTQRDSARLERSSIPDLQHRPAKKVTMLVPEMDRRSSTGETRGPSYPSFSKAHSRESTGRDDQKASITDLTPDTTDMSPKRRSHDLARPRTATAEAPVRPPSRAPPSPPLTADGPDLNRTASRSNSKRTSDKPRTEKVGLRKSMESGLRTNSQSRNSDSSSSKRKPSPLTPDSEDESSDTEDSDPSTAMHEHPSAPVTHSALANSQKHVSSSQTTADSQATSRAAERRTHRRGASSTEAVHGGRVRVHKGIDPVRHVSVHSESAAVVDPVLPQGNDFSPEPATFSPNPAAFSPHSFSAGMPPPPPPPPMVQPQDAPRVDYLLQNGGLTHPIARNFIPIAGSSRPPANNEKRYRSPFPISTGHSMSDLTDIFGQLGSRVDDLLNVLSKDGSIAAATGYRPVARKMLDRLQSVFCRDLTDEVCDCVLCYNVPRLQYEFSGYNWGEMLEYAAGRHALPQWPPFTITPNSPGLGISEAPMQKLDPDVPEDWREHYMKQNARTKRVVQDWLQRHTESPSSPPLDVDNETLTFAMITHLDSERRPLFSALMRGMSTVPASRAATPVSEPNHVLAKAAVSLQRIYRLPTLPRDPEVALWLLNNPALHDMLITVADVETGEWDILVSGRFDGFLWGGGEAVMPSMIPGYGSRAPSRGPTATPMSGGAPSRGTTPFSPLRNVMSPDQYALPPSCGATPAPGNTGAVQYDEEMEIAVAGEVEQELFRAMEMLEDHLEQVHSRAQTVLDALRLRQSGLIATARARKGSLASEVDVRMDTPASMLGSFEEGSYLDDAASELAPDDSASNVGFTRRRKARRHERRTPAAVEEEDEDGAGGSSSRRHR